MVQYDMIQYNTIWMIWCDTTPDDIIPFETIEYGMMQYQMIVYHKIQSNMRQYNLIQDYTIPGDIWLIRYDTIWYDMIQYDCR